MATKTYRPIAYKLLDSAVSNIVISNIPSDYRHLSLTIHSNTASIYRLNPNGSSANGVQTYLEGFGGNFLRDGQRNSIDLLYQPAGGDFHIKVEIFDYKESDRHKSFIVNSGSALDGQSMFLSTWQSLDPITSLEIVKVSGNDLPVGTGIALFGIEG